MRKEEKAKGEKDVEQPFKNTLFLTAINGLSRTKDFVIHFFVLSRAQLLTQREGQKGANVCNSTFR